MYGGVKTGSIKDVHATLDFIPGLSDMRVSDIPGELLAPNTKSSPFFKTLSELHLVLPRASSIIISTYEELSHPALNHHLQSMFRKVLSVGFFTLSLPLPPLPPSYSDPTGCLSWLDGQKPRSVAYVSFGTVTVLPQDELVALAEALEETKVPFLWSLKDHQRSALPGGFMERTIKRGKMVAWAPQTQVLAHEAVAVFVTHCGTNSVYEGVAAGVPLIGRPFFGDQQMMGRLAESLWKNGLQIEGGKLTRSGLVKSLELILGQDNEQGKKIRDGTKALKQMVLEADHGHNSKAVRDLKVLVNLISATLNVQMLA